MCLKWYFKELTFKSLLKQRSVDVTSKNELFGCIFAQNQSKNYRKKLQEKFIPFNSGWSLYMEVANSAAYYMEKVNINIVRVHVHLAKFVKALYCLYMSCTMYHINVQTFWLWVILGNCEHAQNLHRSVHAFINYVITGRCMFVC